MTEEPDPDCSVSIMSHSVFLLLHQFSAHHKDEDNSSPRICELTAAPVWGTQEVQLCKEDMHVCVCVENYMQRRKTEERITGAEQKTIQTCYS